jgi:hypothetical protein
MEKRLYSLFGRSPSTGKWVRLSPYAFRLGIARRHWQGALLASVLCGLPERRLRPAQPLDCTMPFSVPEELK